MTDQHPINPPPEQVWEWQKMLHGDPCPVEDATSAIDLVTTLAAQWGADQELEACCDYIRDYQYGFVDLPDGTKIHRAVDLELARRPKPSSLKEQALKELRQLPIDPELGVYASALDTIRRALEQLND